MGMSKYEMSAMEYLLRYGKDGKKVERRGKVWRIVWVVLNIVLGVGIVLGILGMNR